MAQYSHFLTQEVSASFERHFREVARMQATPQQKAGLFIAKTRLDQHFLGLQMGEEGGKNYQEAGEGIKIAIHAAILNVVSKDSHELVRHMHQLDMSSYQSMLEGAFSLFQPQVNLGHHKAKSI